jgi:hypothetical protein
VCEWVKKWDSGRRSTAGTEYPSDGTGEQILLLIDLFLFVACDVSFLNKISVTMALCNRALLYVGVYFWYFEVTRCPVSEH